MLARIFSAFANRVPVHVAQTPEERSAVQRLRYRVYVAELNNVRVPGGDPERGEIRHPDDEAPTTLMFYTGTLPDITGCVTVRLLDPSRLPAGFGVEYGVDRFPTIADRPIAHVMFLAAARSMRGTANVIALTSNGVRRCVEDHGVQLMMATAAPGLIRRYQQLGLRPYGAPVASTHRGVQIPVAGVTADLAYLRRCESPWYPTLAKLDKAGRLPQREYASLLPAFTNSGVAIAPAAVRSRVEAAMARHPTPFLAELSAQTRRRVLEGCFTFEFQAGVDLMIEGCVNRDLFVVLDGTLNVIQGEDVVSTLSPGEVFGEVAFFSQDGQRAASVRSKVPGELLHLSHGFLQRLADQHPRVGLEVYRALGRALAHRLDV